MYAGVGVKEREIKDVIEQPTYFFKFILHIVAGILKDSGSL